MNYHVMMLPPTLISINNIFRLNYFKVKFSFLNDDDDNLKPSNKHKFQPSTFITIASLAHTYSLNTTLLLAVTRRQMKTFFKDRSMKNAKHMFLCACI